MAIAAVYFFHGFLVPVLAALIIAFASRPIYLDLDRRLGGRRKLSAAIAIFLILMFLIVPIVFAVIYMSHELEAWIRWAAQANRDGAPPPHWIDDLPLIGPWVAEKWEEYLGKPGDIGQLIQAVSGENIGSIYRTALFVSGRVFGLVLAALFMLIALFFLYKDGDKFAAQLDIIGERLFPERWYRISRVVPATISSTVIGMTIIAVGEGIVLGTAYYLAGVPNFLSFGLLTAVMAMVPGGAPLTFTLISAYLVARGTPINGIALMAWGTVELFIVDKTLRPRLVGGPIKLPLSPHLFRPYRRGQDHGPDRPVRWAGADGADRRDLARMGAGGIESRSRNTAAVGSCRNAAPGLKSKNTGFAAGFCSTENALRTSSLSLGSGRAGRDRLYGTLQAPTVPFGSAALPERRATTRKSRQSVVGRASWGGSWNRQQAAAALFCKPRG